MDKILEQVDEQSHDKVNVAEREDADAGDSKAEEINEDLAEDRYIPRKCKEEMRDELCPGSNKSCK